MVKVNVKQLLCILYSNKTNTRPVYLKIGSTNFKCEIIKQTDLLTLLFTG